MSVVTKFITQKQIIGCRIESVPYTMESAVEFDILGKNFKLTPKIDTHDREYQVGDFEPFQSVQGARMADFSFDMDLQGSGTAGVAPKIGKLLQGCGTKHISGIAGDAYVADSQLNAVPLSFFLAIKGPDFGSGVLGIMVKMRGCMGDVEILYAKTGQPLQAKFKFMGPIVSVTDLAANQIPGLTGNDTTVPPATLSSAVSFLGYPFQAQSVSHKLGNKVDMLEDQATAEGYEGAYVTNRKIMATANPYLARSADQFLWNRATGETGPLTGKFEMWAGSTAQLGNFIDIAGWAAQLIKSHDLGSREGTEMNPVELLFTRGQTGQPIWQITFGSNTGMPGY